MAKDRFKLDSSVFRKGLNTLGQVSITVSFNCGAGAVNNIDTHGQEFSFTLRYYGVSQKVMDGKVTPESNVR
jgi:hypothetical protein